jgi:hypothetical protein
VKSSRSNRVFHVVRRSPLNGKLQTVLPGYVENVRT